LNFGAVSGEEKFAAAVAWSLYGLCCVLGWIGIWMQPSGGVYALEDVDRLMASLIMPLVALLAVFPVFLLLIPFLACVCLVWRFFADRRGA